MRVAEWVDEFADMVRRRLAVIIALAALGTLCSLLFALSQTHRYTSIAVLQVQEAMVADRLASDVSLEAGARHLQLIQQQIMSQGAVREFGTELGLFDDLGGMTETQKVAAVREAVEIRGVAAAREGLRDDGAISLVRIHAEWTDRATAQALAKEITTRTIELSRASRLERARETMAFFALREQELSTRISQLESEIAQFRLANDIAEPVSLEFQQREIETLKAELFAIDRQIIEVQRLLDRTDGRENLSLLEQRERTENLERMSNLNEQRAYIDTRLQSASRLEARDPQIELQLANFERKLNALGAEQTEVIDRRKAAEVLYQLEVRGQSKQFTVLEEASWPDYPSTPSRTKMALLGTVASILAALGLAFLLELRNPVLRSAALMEHELGFAPIVTIPQAGPARRGWPLARLRGPWRRRAL